MDIEFTEDGKVTIRMDDYIRESIDAYSITKGDVATTPATKKLFEVDDESPRLATEDSELFHSIVARLLYVGNRGRPPLNEILKHLRFFIIPSLISILPRGDQSHPYKRTRPNYKLRMAFPIAPGHSNRLE